MRLKGWLVARLRAKGGSAIGQFIAVEDYFGFAHRFPELPNGVRGQEPHRAEGWARSRPVGGHFVRHFTQLTY